jgi:fucose permease
MLVCYAILAVGITLEVISNSQGNPNLVFFLGESINGWGVGALQTTAFTYISEVSVETVGIN